MNLREKIWYIIGTGLEIGYGVGNDFAVKVNGNTVTTTVENNKRVCTISNVEVNQVVTVDGVVDTV